MKGKRGFVFGGFFFGEREIGIPTEYKGLERFPRAVSERNVVLNAERWDFLEPAESGVTRKRKRLIDEAFLNIGGEPEFDT